MKGLILGLLALSLAAAPQDDKRFAPVFGGRRLALVIGNKSYSWKPLVNPANDATAVAKMLTGVGFAQSDVHLVIDANQLDLRRHVREFVESVKPGDLAFVYYSGHGVEVHGANYLLPVDLPSDATEAYVEDEAVSAQRLLRELDQQGAKTKVLILDACRDNPLRAAKSTAGGLAPMEGRGSLIVFATETGRTASDTPGSSNSIFTQYLIDGLRQPGVALFDAMRTIARNVARATNEKQVPSIYGMMLEDVVLVSGPANGSAAQPHLIDRPPATPSEQNHRLDAAQEAWELVKNSSNPDDLEDFAKQFPTSDLAQAAKLRATQLRRANKSQVAERPIDEPPSLPAVMHWCAHYCITFTLQGGIYTNYDELGGLGKKRVIVVETFTRHSVVLRRTDYNGPHPANAVMTGQISSEGDSLFGKLQWASGGSGTFKATWGAALNSLPGSGLATPGMVPDR